MPDQRVVCVTGAGRGIGRTYAEAFVARGNAVVVIDARGDLIEEAVAELGPSCRGFVADVSDESVVNAVFREIADVCGSLDVLVNNAALMLDFERPFKPFWETDAEEWDRVFAVNTRGVFLCCKHALPVLRRASGASVVNITSDAIWHGYAGQMAYFASKGATAVMTRCLARELGKYGIRVNAIAPGLTMSGSVRESETLQELAPRIREDRALHRDQLPSDLVGALLFLSGPDSVAITGQTIVVNSGGIMP